MGHFCEKYLHSIFDNDGSCGTDQFFEYDETSKPDKRAVELDENPK